MEGYRKDYVLKTRVTIRETILKIIERYNREVLTLHLLTITLRRILNPPGFSLI